MQTQELKSSAVLNDIFGVDENFTKDPDAWLQLVHPEHREEVHRYLLDVAHGVYETFDKEYRIIRKSDGSVRWVHGYGILRYDNKERHLQCWAPYGMLPKPSKPGNVLRRASISSESCLKTILLYTCCWILEQENIVG